MATKTKSKTSSATKSKPKRRFFAKFPRRHNRMVLFLDIAVMVMGIIGPLTGLAQAIQIFVTHSAGSVSLLSWGMFVLFNGITLTYGLVHRLMPIIIPNAAWVVVDVAVVVGIMMYP